MCLTRLKSTIKNLRQNPDLLKLYHQTFENQLTKSIIKPIEDEQAQGPTTLLPHQPVATPLKTTKKLQIVFDASTKTAQEISLNNELLKRPSCFQTHAEPCFGFGVSK